MTMPTITLRKGRARPFWHGNPVVFSGAIERVEGEPCPGAFVEVHDSDGRVIGHGFFNPFSDYRVRIVRLSTWLDAPSDPAGLVAWSMAGAAAIRASLGLPSAETDAWRMVNSEGDFLSGLTVDVFAGVAVVQASALWVEKMRCEIDAAIGQVLARDVEIVHALSQGVARLEGLRQVPDPAGRAVEVLENGVRFLVDCGRGQKTGFFIDQRANRMLVRSMAKGRRVLDAFCFTGGFALNAAAGGALDVLAVDTSGMAVAAARENAAMNGIRAVRFEEADAIDVLDGGERWDMVICDPPKLARSHRDIARAISMYRRINRAAIGALADGGILVTCSCSSAMRRDQFLEVLRDAAAEASRRFTITHVLGAGPDHTLNPAFPEGEYLKCVVGVVGNGS